MKGEDAAAAKGEPVGGVWAGGGCGEVVGIAMNGEAIAGAAAAKGDLAVSAAAFTDEKGDTVFKNGESTGRGAEAAMPKGEALPAFGACGIA